MEPLFRSANWAAKDGVALIDNLFLGKVLGAGMQMSAASACHALTLLRTVVQLHMCTCEHACTTCCAAADMGLIPALHGQIFELRDGTGRIAPIVLKVLKSGALIGDIEREWEAGQRVSQLADKDGNLPVRLGSPASTACSSLR
jgi:hypothetical protein